MTTLTSDNWRKVEPSDFRPSIGWAEDDLMEEVPLFKEFISPYNRNKPKIALGGIYRLWKEFRGDDVIYALSINDLKRIWTALSVVYPDDPIYSVVPTECILYDNSTKSIINQIAPVPV